MLPMLTSCERALIGDITVIEAESKQGNPDLVILSTRDLDLFSQAYDAAGTAANSTPVFQANYIDKASPVVQATLASSRVTGATFQQTVGRYPRFYQSVRKTASTAIQGQL